jgi:predicted GNAT family acetyltransferase
MTTEVRHNAERMRYELWVGGVLVGIANYELDGERVVFPHTEVIPALRGLGYAAGLVRGALDDVRANGRTVVPKCWYVAHFLQRHPEYHELVRV